MRTRPTGAAHIVGLCTPWVKPALRRRTAADIDAATDLLARLEACDGPLRGPVPADPHPPSAVVARAPTSGKSRLSDADGGFTNLIGTSGDFTVIGIRAPGQSP
jgi:hypothetical protein